LKYEKPPMGLEMVGTRPTGFNHKTRGLVDAQVLYPLLA
jgi:hypothetical protein